MQTDLSTSQDVLWTAWLCLTTLYDAPIGPPQALVSTTWTPTICPCACKAGGLRQAAWSTSSAEKGSFLRRGLSWLNHLRDQAPDSTNPDSHRAARSSSVRSAARVYTTPRAAGETQREPNRPNSGKQGSKPCFTHGSSVDQATGD